jgi:tetratricopeptide (TPR) repeat protein
MSIQYHRKGIYEFDTLSILSTNETLTKIGVRRKMLDLTSVRSQNLPECVNRALGNLGRVCVKLRRYDEAINIFEEKLSSSPVQSLEKAWLLHDVGRCHFELGRDVKAKEMGEASAVVAEAVKDSRWCLNAYVLVGQAESKFLNM